MIYKEVKSDNKRLVVIIDEAHSSQTGDTAKELKRVFADTEKILEEYAAMQYEDEEKHKDAENKLLDELANDADIIKLWKRYQDNNNYAHELLWADVVNSVKSLYLKIQ